MSIIRTNIENARTIVSSNPVLPANTAIGNVSSTELSYLDGVTSGIQSQLNGKLNLGGGSLTGPLYSPNFLLSSGYYRVFSGTVSAGFGQEVPILQNSGGYNRTNGIIYITANESYNGHAVYVFEHSAYGLGKYIIYNDGGITLTQTSSGYPNYTLNIRNDYSSIASYQVTMHVHSMGPSALSSNLNRII